MTVPPMASALGGAAERGPFCEHGKIDPLCGCVAMLIIARAVLPGGMTRISSSITIEKAAMCNRLRGTATFVKTPPAGGCTWNGPGLRIRKYLHGDLASNLVPSNRASTASVISVWHRCYAAARVRRVRSPRGTVITFKIYSFSINSY